MRILLAMIFAASATAGLAANSSSYAALDRASAAACSAASGLRNPSVGAPTRFSDRFLMDARVVTGTWPQKHMKGARATMLCLYNRRSKRAEVQEFAAAPVPTPTVPANIRDVWWQVAAINGQRPVGSRPLTMMLGSDGKIGGNSGCNGYSVSYRLTGTALKLYPPIVGTEIACASEVMAQESRYRDILARVVTAVRDRDGALTLSTDDRRTLRFIAASKG